MKKFVFALDKALDFKEQVQNELTNEHAQILQRIKAQEDYLNDLNCELSCQIKKLDEEKINGCTISTINMYESYIKSFSAKINRTKQVIAELRITEQKKLAEVLEAKIETSTIEKLKDKKIQQHMDSLRVEEEHFIEEFVSNANSVKRNP